MFGGFVEYPLPRDDMYRQIERNLSKANRDSTLLDDEKTILPNLDKSPKERQMQRLYKIRAEKVAAADQAEEAFFANRIETTGRRNKQFSLDLVQSLDSFGSFGAQTLGSDGDMSIDQLNQSNLAV